MRIVTGTCIATTAKLRRLGKEVYKMALTCTQPSDWQKALKISKELNYPIALGAHPWWIHENKSTFHAWIEELETLASATPLSIIGEIGLDKIAVPLDGVTPPDYPFQLEAFTKQLDLARKLNKPIAVHCVKGDVGYPKRVIRMQENAARRIVALVQRLLGMDATTDRHEAK